MAFISPTDFENLGRQLAGYSRSTSERIRRERFNSCFGVNPIIVSVVWSMLIDNELCSPSSPKPVHLLWALLFLKLYDSTPKLAALAGCDEKTFRKWSWFYVGAIASLDRLVVSWSPSCWWSIFLTPINNCLLRSASKIDSLDGMAGKNVLCTLMEKTSRQTSSITSRSDFERSGTPRSTTILVSSTRSVQTLLLETFATTLVLLELPSMTWLSSDHSWNQSLKHGRRLPATGATEVMTRPTLFMTAGLLKKNGLWTRSMPAMKPSTEGWICLVLWKELGGMIWGSTI